MTKVLFITFLGTMQKRLRGRGIKCVDFKLVQNKRTSLLDLNIEIVVVGGVKEVK